MLRPSLLPGVVDAVAHNRRRGQEDARLFEVGTIFTVEGGERRALGLGWVGAAAPRHWSGSGRAVDFFDMKGAVELIAVRPRRDARADARGLPVSRPRRARPPSR